MKSIVVSSTAPYSGKSGISLALASALEGRRLGVGYFKPYGTMPESVDGLVTDRDAHFINGSLASPGPVGAVCPVVRTTEMVEKLLDGRPADTSLAVREAWAHACADRDVMVVEGPSDLQQGRGFGVSLGEVVEMLDARVLLVEKAPPHDVPDGVLAAAAALGPRLGGVVFNRVRECEFEPVEDRIAPFLRANGVAVFGALRHDPLLSSVSVAEILETMGGVVLCGSDHLDAPVETFMVGAMGQEKALRFFRRKANKAVITGGDRADVQLAALETSTTALLLTGGQTPSSIVLARADELGVPVVLLEGDTLDTVERMESIMGQARLHGPGKADRIRAMFIEGVDVDALVGAFGL